MKEQIEHELFNMLVDKMTNHERNLWARAGYPGLRGKEIDKLEPYAHAARRRIGYAA